MFAWRLANARGLRSPVVGTVLFFVYVVDDVYSR